MDQYTCTTIFKMVSFWNKVQLLYFLHNLYEINEILLMTSVNPVIVSPTRFFACNPIYLGYQRMLFACNPIYLGYHRFFLHPSKEWATRVASTQLAFKSPRLTKKVSLSNLFYSFILRLHFWKRSTAII